MINMARLSTMFYVLPRHVELNLIEWGSCGIIIRYSSTLQILDRENRWTQLQWGDLETCQDRQVGAE